MPEELTFALVLEELLRLHTAFPTHTGMKSKPEATAKVYRDGLHGLAGEALRAATGIVIESDTYFPKVARLREVAWDWTKRHSVDAVPLADALWCPRCQSRARWERRHRPHVDKDGFAIYSSDGVYLLLATTERLNCACAVPSLYKAEPNVEIAGYPVMRRELVKWSHSRPGQPMGASPWAKPAGFVATSVGDVAEKLFEEAAIHA